MLGADGLAGALGSNGHWLLPVADVVGAAGNALFANLPLLFALGVAVGYARKPDGSTGLAALTGTWSSRASRMPCPPTCSARRPQVGHNSSSTTACSVASSSA